MKVFISAVAVFILLICLISLNTYFVCSQTDLLIESTESLSASPNIDETDRLIELWYKYEDFINLTVDHKTTDQIELTLHQLNCYAGYDDATSYEAARRSLLVLLYDMKDSSYPSFDRIF